jgi:AraC-like DNA-binding protein/HAMP domain-containing protein
MRLLKFFNNNKLSGAIVRAGLAAFALPLAIAALFAGFCQTAQETEKMKTGMGISLATASLKLEEVFFGAENDALMLSSAQALAAPVDFLPDGGSAEAEAEYAARLRAFLLERMRAAEGRSAAIHDVVYHDPVNGISLSSRSGSFGADGADGVDGADGTDGAECAECADYAALGDFGEAAGRGAEFGGGGPQWRVLSRDDKEYAFFCRPLPAGDFGGGGFVGISVDIEALYGELSGYLPEDGESAGAYAAYAVYAADGAPLIAGAGLSPAQELARGGMFSAGAGDGLGEDEVAGAGAGAGAGDVSFAEIAGRGGKWLCAYMRAPSGRAYAYMAPKRLLASKIASAAALTGAGLLALLLLGAAILAAMSRRIIKPVASLVGQSRELLSGQNMRGEGEGEGENAVGAHGAKFGWARGAEAGFAQDSDACAPAVAVGSQAGVPAAARGARLIGAGCGGGGFAGVSDEISYLQRAFDNMARRLAGLSSRAESVAPLLRELALQSIAEGFADGGAAAACADLIGFPENAVYVALAAQPEVCGGEWAATAPAVADAVAAVEVAPADADAVAATETAPADAGAAAVAETADYAVAGPVGSAVAGHAGPAVAGPVGSAGAAGAPENALEAVRATIAGLIGADERVGGAAYAVPALGQCRALLCCGAGARDGEAERMAASIAQELCDFARREHIPLAVGIGRPARSLAGCRLSCGEAQAALKRRLAMEDGRGVCAFEAEPATPAAAARAASAPAPKAAGRPFPTEISEQIIRALNEPDLELAQRQLGLFCRFVQSSCSHSFIFQSFNILLARVIVAHQERGGAAPALLDADFFERLSRIPSPGGMASWFAGSLFPLYLSLGDMQLKSDGKAAIHRIVRYIAENVSGDLSLVRCADLAGINPSYASRMFKEETGYSFLEYVVKIRIDKAKDMLRHTTVSVASIAEAIGYSNRSMYRIFFKETGMSPNEFRVTCQ